LTFKVIPQLSFSTEAVRIAGVAKSGLPSIKPTPTHDTNQPTTKPSPSSSEVPHAQSEILRSVTLSKSLFPPHLAILVSDVRGAWALAYHQNSDTCTALPN